MYGFKVTTRQNVVAYDRAMYENHVAVSVGYLDGSAATIGIEDFTAALSTPPNADTDYDLPARE